jgi:hypothetical protein
LIFDRRAGRKLGLPHDIVRLFEPVFSSVEKNAGATLRSRRDGACLVQHAP